MGAPDPSGQIDIDVFCIIWSVGFLKFVKEDGGFHLPTLWEAAEKQAKFEKTY